MTPTERAPLQKAILDGARAVEGARPTQAKVADAMGFDRTEYGRFERGERKLDLDEIVGACEDQELGGAAAILGPLAARFGLRIVAEGAAPVALKELPRVSARITSAAAELGAGIAEALEDGRVTDEEADDLQRQVDQLAAAVHRLTARRVRAGRVG